MWVMEVTGPERPRALGQHPVLSSCAVVCVAAQERVGRALAVLRIFIIRTDSRENGLERVPGCQGCWAEQAGALRLLRAGNRFLK